MKNLELDCYNYSNNENIFSEEIIDLRVVLGKQCIACGRSCDKKNCCGTGGAYLFEGVGIYNGQEILMKIENINIGYKVITKIVEMFKLAQCAIGNEL